MIISKPKPMPELFEVAYSEHLSAGSEQLKQSLEYTKKQINKHEQELLDKMREHNYITEMLKNLEDVINQCKEWEHLASENYIQACAWEAYAKSLEKPDGSI